MQTNRRYWLKQIGLGFAGVGLANFKTIASPTEDIFDFNPDDAPIKLSSNENPYGPSSMAKTAMAKNVHISNRYNWQLTSELIENLAKKNNVTSDNILMGAGSTEILDLVARFAALEKGNLIIADPSYDYWTSAAQKLGLKKITVPVTSDKKLDLPAMLKAITSDTKLIYVCNPNNPTGTICDRTELIDFINEATKKAMVLVDEAYIDFTPQQSLSTLAVKNKNLVVAKTFSKIYGLAGARVGYAIGNDQTLNQLSELQSWANGSISVASTAAAIASLQDKKFVADTNSLNEKTRQFTNQQFEKLNLHYIPSYSNFVYFSLTNYNKDFFEQLKTNKISGTRIYEEQGKWTRITVGTMKEMQKFFSAIV